MDHSQRDCGDNPQDQTEVCCLTLQPPCRTTGRRQDRTWGVGLMTRCAQQGPATWMYSTFSLDRSLPTSNVRRTSDLVRSPMNAFRSSPPVAPGVWVILAPRSSRFARRITVCVCVIRPCTTTGGQSGMPFLQKTQTTRCWMFVTAERDRSIEGSEGSPRKARGFPVKQLSASRHERQSNPWRHAPDWSFNGREKVVEKNGPFSLTFCQIVAYVATSQCVRGLFVGSHRVSSSVEMKLALSQEEESQRTFQGGNVRQRPLPACRRGISGGSDSLTGASGAPRRC